MRLFSRLLPNEPDVLGLLNAQALVTVGGMAALVEWAQGDKGASLAVREAEHEADERKRTLRLVLREAFVTPLGAEDIFFLSAKLDAVLGGAKDLVREAEALGVEPDAHMAEMASSLAESVGELANSFEALAGGRRSFERATGAADAAHRAVRQIEHTYREAMTELLSVATNAPGVAARRELYQRLSRLSSDVTKVADRVWYVAVKES